MIMTRSDSPRSWNSRLGTRDESSSGRFVLIVMAGVIFFFGYLGYLRIAADKDGAVLFAFATTALGAIAGLLAPSPMAK